MKQMDTAITHEIMQLIEEYKERYNFTYAREINQGYCVEFAEELEERCKGYEGLGNINTVSEDVLRFDEGYTTGYEEGDTEAGQLPDSGWNRRAIEQVYHSPLPVGTTLAHLNAFGETGYHVWVECNGKFYDAECPTGVTSIFELPFYERYMWRNRH